jgi:hypothetical protein
MIFTVNEFKKQAEYFRSYLRDNSSSVDWKEMLESLEMVYLHTASEEGGTLPESAGKEIRDLYVDCLFEYDSKRKSKLTNPKTVIE